MIEDLGRHKYTKFTPKEMVVDKALRSPLFDNSEEIGGAYDIKEFKRTVSRDHISVACRVSTGKVANLITYRKWVTTLIYCHQNLIIIC